MAITKTAGRQWPIYAVQRITVADLGNTDGTYEAIDLPPGARLLGGRLVVATAWNDGTAATLSVGLTTGTATALLAATSIQTPASTAFTGASPVSNAQTTITVTAAFTDEDATTGVAYLMAEYVIDDRATEAQ